MPITRDRLGRFASSGGARNSNAVVKARKRTLERKYGVSKNRLIETGIMPHSTGKGSTLGARKRIMALKKSDPAKDTFKLLFDRKTQSDHTKLQKLEKVYDKYRSKKK